MQAIPSMREIASTRGFTTADPERQGIRWDAPEAVAKAPVLGFHPSLQKTALTRGRERERQPLRRAD
jgi:hypothetical protein